MKFHSVWIVWLLACISIVLCQDGIGTNDATKSSILSEISKLQDFENTTSQKPSLIDREEQIEDELSNDATTTEKFMEKRKFIIKPENEEYREIFTVRFNETGPTTARTNHGSTKRNKSLYMSSFKKHDEPVDDVTNIDDVEFTTLYDGLTKKSSVDNGERKTRQRFDGLKGVTTNRGKTRFQNEPGTSEIPELLMTLRHKKPIRVIPIDQNTKDESSTLLIDDLIDTTTVLDIPEVDQQKPKFKKPPPMATHHTNFGTSTEAPRKPIIRQNLNLKQKISSSTIKTRPLVTEPENTILTNKTVEVNSSNMQLNKNRPIKITSSKESAVQQPIPPTATAWALASLKAPNNTNRMIRKPLNVTNNQEQISKIKPFVTWSTRLQKTNDENSNITTALNNTLVAESNDPSIEVSSESNTANRLTPEITSTESLIHTISTLSTAGHALNGNDTTVTIIGGDTDQNKYEVYGSQKPDIENTTTVIETLRPSSSTISSESQNSNLLLVTSYKSILENNNTSEVQQNIFTSSETPILENTQKKEFVNHEFTATTNQPSPFKNSEETPKTENIEDHKFPVSQISTEMSSKEAGFLFDYSTTTTDDQPSNSDKTFSLSHDSDLNNQNFSSTTEHYIDNIKTKLDGKINEFTDNHDPSEIVDFTHIMFPSERPILSSTDGAEIVSTASEKTTSELPLPSNDISNTSQVPSWFNSPDTFFTDFESKLTEGHDDTGDDGHKTFESSSQSSTAVYEPTSESDISENDVPVVTSSSTSKISTTSTNLTTTTTSTTTTTTTPKPITPSTTLEPTTTTTIPEPTTTTTTSRSITTTLIPRRRPTTTTTTTTTTITPRSTTTTQRTTTSTSPPIVIETTTPTTTTVRSTTLSPTTTPSPNIPTTTTSKPTPITSRPKPTMIDISSTTSEPYLPIDQLYLRFLVNSTVKDVCESEDELKAAIIKLFESGTESVRTENQIRFLNINEKECLNPNDERTPVGVEFYLINSDGEYDEYMNEEFINLFENHQFDYKSNILGVEFMKQIIEKENNINKEESENPRVQAAIYLSIIGAVCIILLLVLLVVRKRQKRFNYGQRCTPVSLDDYSMDNISVYNSVRRKGALRASKRSYGNPAFDDSTAVSHPLNFAGLASFADDRPAVDEQFSTVPAITVKPDELPAGAETKNRYANVIPVPETRVALGPHRGHPGHDSADYINANFVKGYKGAEKYYIACQAPMQSTLPDFWQMIWEQNTRVIMMLTSLTEKGVERCADYLPPSEVLDCHRLFGDYQVTLKKREVKDKFIISSLQLKNLESNLWRDVTHLWYGGWPVQGVPSDPGAVLTFLMEARSHMKTSNNGPIVVHCSPGTGRTGTVIACDIAIREFELSRTVDVPKTVYAVRRCRAGAVQTRDQYALIYKVVNLYANKLSGGLLDSI